MAFRDLAALTDGLRITLPIRGKHYVIKDVDAETGLWAQRLWDLGTRAGSGQGVDGAELDDDEESALYERLLGESFAEMKADGVRWGEIRHVGLTVLIWVTNGQDAAEAYWENALKDGEGDDAPGEASTPGRQGSRPASGGAATTTPTRASGSGTRAGTSRPKPKKGRPGAKSSRSGR